MILDIVLLLFLTVMGYYILYAIYLFIKNLFK